MYTKCYNLNNTNSAIIAIIVFILGRSSTKKQNKKNRFLKSSKIVVTGKNRRDLFCQRGR